MHAAKMYRFSVSYTQRGVFSILAVQTQALATTNKKKLGAEVQRRAAVRSRSQTIAGGQKKNTQEVDQREHRKKGRNMRPSQTDSGTPRHRGVS